MSDTMNLIPTEALTSGSSDALSAAAGAFIGSWFGNGFMNGGWGGGYGYGRNGYVPGGISDSGAYAASAAVGSGITDALMNRLTNLDSNLDRLTISELQGQCNTEKAVAESGNAILNSIGNSYARITNDMNSGFSGVTGAVNAGTAQVAAAVNETNARTNNYLAQGFAGLNTAIQGNGYETRLNVKDLQAAMAGNCCGIKNAIIADGAMTRQLIQANFINDLQTKLCDAKATIASLENQAYTAQSNAAQTQAIITALKSS